MKRDPSYSSAGACVLSALLVLFTTSCAIRNKKESTSPARPADVPVDMLVVETPTRLASVPPEVEAPPSEPRPVAPASPSSRRGQNATRRRGGAGLPAGELPDVEAPDVALPGDGETRLTSPEPAVDSVSAVDQLVRALALGSVVFDPPAVLHYEQSEMLSLRLVADGAEHGLLDALKKSTKLAPESVRISSRMTAELKGHGAQIEAVSPATQIVTSLQTTEWSWLVRPQQAGKLSLTVSLTALISVAGKEGPLHVRTYQRTVDVEITMRQRATDFAKTHWQWICTTCVLPVLAFFWNRKSRKQPSPNVA